VDNSFVGESGRLVAIVALIAMNGFFVAAEFALVTVRRTRVEQLVEEGRVGSRAVLRAHNHLDVYIAACQLGMTMAALALGWIAEPAIAVLIGPPFEVVLGVFGDTTVHTVSVAFSFVIVTTLLVVAGELAPKRISLAAPDRVALVVVPVTNVFTTIFKPVIWFLNKARWAVLRPFGIEPAGHTESVSSIEELKLVVMASREAGLLEKREQQMVNRVFTLSTLTTKQAMVPRTKVLAIGVEATVEDILDFVQQARHTRIPVFEGSIDNVIGVLNVKDLLVLLRDRGGPFPGVRRLVRPALIVPESTRLDDLLAEMRHTRMQMAIVMDEFGGTAGIVTLENILERLVGEVQSELESPETPKVVQQPDGSYFVDGMMLIEDFDEQFGLRMEDDDYDTIGGCLFGQLGRRPKSGDEITLPDGRTLRVEALDGLRISRVRLSPPLVLRESDAAPD
jgi:CBS domain containing-hemolysin-like protein